MSLFTNIALSAFSVVSFSIIPIPRSIIGAIKEFRFNLSVLFQMNYKYFYLSFSKIITWNI